MSEGFSAAFFKKNRDSLRNLFAGTAPIVLTANGLLQSTADMTFPFRQDSSFWYFTGLNEPDLILVIDKGKEYLISPAREHVQEVFSGSIDAERLIAVSGVPTVLSNKDGWKQLASRLKRVKHLATLTPMSRFVEAHGFYTNPARATLIKRAKAVKPDIEILDLRRHIAMLRMIKQPVELAAIKQAIAITERAVRGLLKRSWNADTTELAFENELLYQFRKLGSEGPAFDSVVAAGSNSCIIHHLPDQTLLRLGRSLLLDVGAQVNRYAADITRTYSVGRPSKRLRQIHQAVRGVQDYARGLLKPGIIIRRYEKDVERFMGEKLRELGLIKSIDHENVRRFFSHATSHHLGLDAHDAADYDKPLLPHMVLTVEPGIYVPDEEIGVRLEDDVLITDSGNQILSTRLSCELESLTIKPD